MLEIIVIFEMLEILGLNICLNISPSAMKYRKDSTHNVVYK